MAPKRKAEQSSVTAAPAGRLTRSAARITRSSGTESFIELPDTRKSKSSVTKKAKKADVKGKGKAKAVEEDSVSEDEKIDVENAENDVEVPNKTVIIIEHCKQCSSFKKTANQVKEGLEKSELDVIVKLNPEKPRRGCFEVRQEGEGGKTFVSLLDLKRPFKPMKDLDLKKLISDIVDDLSS